MVKLSLIYTQPNRFENRFLYFKNKMTKLTENMSNEIDSNNNNNNNSKKAKIESNANLSNNNFNESTTMNAQLNHINLLVCETNNKKTNQNDQTPLWSPDKTNIQQETKLVEFRHLIEAKYKVKLGRS
jgi:hypothetical protein